LERTGKKSEDENMETFESVDALLDFAIEKEQESKDFYLDVASKMEREHMKKVFEDFAGEEQGHLENLLAIKRDKIFTCPVERIQDLKISDYLIDIKPDPEMDYQDALILAMKKEKATYKLYNDLIQMADDENLKETLRCLAQEEAKHKLRLEIEYDEYILTEQ
jgi:rubrerythrin